MWQWNDGLGDYEWQPFYPGQSQPPKPAPPAGSSAAPPQAARVPPYVPDMGLGPDISLPIGQFETEEERRRKLMAIVSQAGGQPAGLPPIPPTGGGAAGGVAAGGVPSGFSSQGEYDAWRAQFMAEHGGQTPEQYYRGDINRAVEERNASKIWAAQHGNPASWGYGALNTRVPMEVFRRIASARHSPDYGPLGPAAWAQAADMLGGGELALQGKAYHPSQTVGEETTTTGTQSLFALDEYGPLDTGRVDWPVWSVGGEGCRSTLPPLIAPQPGVILRRVRGAGVKGAQAFSAYPSSQDKAASVSSSRQPCPLRRKHGHSIPPRPQAVAGSGQHRKSRHRCPGSRIFSRVCGRTNGAQGHRTVGLRHRPRRGFQLSRQPSRP